MVGKWVFIVNLVAGNGAAKKLIDPLQNKIKDLKIDAELVYTQHKGHASEITEDYLSMGYDHFIAVGGDGTFNEMGKVLLNKKDVTVGIIPAGTGNDFIQILGFPNRFQEKDWEIFFKQNSIAMDAGSVNGNTFFNGMGLGFDAQVASENYEGPGIVKQGGKNKYIWHIVKTLLFYREGQMTVTSRSETQETACFINTISIGRRFAGGFFLTPNAIANDGLLDVCMIKKLTLLQRFKILLQVPKGTHINDRKVNYYQTDKLELQFKEDVPFHVDGELNFATKFDVSILPGALNIIYNPSGDHYFKS